MLDGRCHICFAVDTKHGLRGGIAVTDDFQEFDILSITAPDNRNLVLFPEKIDGKYFRLECPFAIYNFLHRPEPIFDLWCSSSPDLRHWGDTSLVLAAEQVPFGNSKIGPGAPPVKTDKGWLTFFHAVRKCALPRKGWERHPWQREYVAGVMLLDLENPAKILGLYSEPLLQPEPQYDYEIDGFRGSVIFPTGLVPTGDGKLFIYYGAADTVAALAIADQEELVRMCLHESVRQ